MPVIAAANPLRGARLRRGRVSDLVRTIEGPVVLVAHSYGGAVISNVDADAGDIAGLVYVAGFAPEAGRELLLARGHVPGQHARRRAPAGAAQRRHDRPLHRPNDRFHEQFAADVCAPQQRVMAVTQRPVTQEALLEPSGDSPLWKRRAVVVPDRRGGPQHPADLQRYMAERSNARSDDRDPGRVTRGRDLPPRPTARLILEAAALRVAA